MDGNESGVSVTVVDALKLLKETRGKIKAASVLEKAALAEQWMITAEKALLNLTREYLSLADYVREQLKRGEA